MDQITYEESLQAMFRLHRFGIKLGLDTISAMLSALDNPHLSYKCIHISGTNGKGSIAATLSTILKTAGYKVGRYTSPHLERFNERICIDDQPVGDDEVVAAYRRASAISGLERQPTFFEFTTAMALDIFNRHQVQWAVIETGMGGRLDATNILNPALTLITNISLEHRNYLGDTIEVIAGEKAGIIKPGVPVISGVRQKSAQQVVRDKALKEQSRLFQFRSDFKIRRHPNQRFSYYGPDSTWRNLELSLSGDHQYENAALAMAACECLVANNLCDVSEAHIREGLLKTEWPGRLEVAGTNPYLILDGAHNLMAARLLRRHLEKYFSDRNITLVVGILDDKPYRSILKDLISPCHRVIITSPKIDRAIPGDRLEPIVREHASDVTVREDVADAVKLALSRADKDDVICVAGSLYVVGEAKTALRNLPGT